MTYTNVTVSGYNANPPEDDGTVASSNEISWAKHKTKIGDPLKTAIESIDTNVDAAFLAVEARTPAGLIAPFAAATAPTGWLLCDGSTVSQSTYADLYTLLGTTYGSDAGGNFTLPDLEGRMVAGLEAAATRLTTGVGGVDGGTLGAVGGAQSHQLTEAQLASHDHGVTDSGHTHTLSQSLVGGAAGGPNVINGLGGGTGVTTASRTTGITINNAGSDNAHPNVQPTIILAYIIKT